MISLFTVRYTPQPDQRPYLERSQTQTDDSAEVTVAVPTPAECAAVFGLRMAKHGIQPVWVRVVNRSPSAVRVLLTKMAPAYFTAREAAGICHFSILKRLAVFGLFGWLLSPLIALILPFKLVGIRRANRRMDDCFQSLGLPTRAIAPGEAAEGFVFTPLDFGTKVVDVGLLTIKGVQDYMFSVIEPTPALDLHRSPAFASEPGPTVDCDLDSLLARLPQMPSATTNAVGRRTGDPVNLVVVGDFVRLIGVFAARWDQTEIITLGSCWRTVKSFLLGSEYRYSPVSGLYLFGRPQDFALQRVRGSINERLHLRLWATPLRLDGQMVWVGQVSRDIGVRFTWANLEPHHPSDRFRR